MLDGPSTARSPRIARLLLASTVVVAAATAAVSVRLVRAAVEDQVGDELARTADLLGGAGFPLGDASLERVAGLVGGAVVAVDPEGHVVAASLDPAARAAFEAARRAGTVPAPDPSGRIRVVQAAVGAARYTVGVAPTPGRRGAGAPAAVYVLREAGLVEGAARRAWLPVSVVAGLAVVLAALLGVAGERAVLRARTGALLRLLAAVAHEVRNPLGAIRAIARTQARVAARGGAVDAARLELVAAETERLSLLVDGLRNVGRPVATVRAPVELDAAVRGTLDLVAHHLAHRGVTVELDLTAPTATALADATQVRQVVLNLVTNGADALLRGGTLRVSSCADADRWTLAVEDSGPGVPEPLRHRLFEPFFTTKPKGLGVGLFLSRRLARAHGGELDLAPTPPGRGARFVLTLPRAAAPAPPPAPTPAAHAAQPADHAAQPAVHAAQPPVPAAAGAGPAPPSPAASGAPAVAAEDPA